MLGFWLRIVVSREIRAEALAFAGQACQGPGLQL